MISDVAHDRFPKLQWLSAHPCTQGWYPPDSVGYQKDEDKKRKKRRRIQAGDVGVLEGVEVGSGVWL